MAKPTFVNSYNFTYSTSPSTNWTAKPGSGTGNSGSVSIQTNDVLIGVSVAEDNSFDGDNCVDSGGQTWTVRQDVDAASYADVKISSAIAASSTTTSFRHLATSGSHAYGAHLFQFRDSDGVGASQKNNSSSPSVPSVSLTTTQANSAVVVIVADWNATNGSTRTWLTVNGVTPTSGNGLEKVYFRDANTYTVYAAYYDDVGSAGSKTFGLSDPSGQRYSIAAIEIKNTSGPSPISGSSSITEAADTVSSTGEISVAQETLFDNETPSNGDSSDSPAVNLGMVVTFDVDGYVPAIKVYHSNTTPVEVTATLWQMLNRSGGTEIASANGSVGGGWATIDFDEPIEVTANTPYMVSYFKPSGGSTPYYHYTSSKFNSEVHNGNIRGIAHGNNTIFELEAYNGLYKYDSSKAMPESASAGTWFAVDVIFQTQLESGGDITGTATITEADDTISSAGQIGSGSLLSLFGGEIPSSSDSSDNSAYTLGMVVDFAANGFVHGISVYRSASAIDVSVAIWEMTGGSVAETPTTATGSAGGGWTTINFSSPVPVVSGQPYVVGWFKESGGSTPYYHYTSNKHASDVSNNGIRAIATSDTTYWGEATRNGRYRADNPSAIELPVSYTAPTWYGVDLVYSTESEPPEGITGSASITEADDTISSASTILIKASTSITEAGDTISSAAVHPVRASASITEADDTISSASTILIKASTSITEAGDTISSASTILIKASAPITEADDTISSAGTSQSGGITTITEQDDTISSVSVILLRSIAENVEADDTISSAAVHPVRASVSITEAADTLSSASDSQNTGVFTATETNDTISSISKLLANADVSITEADDTIVSVGAFATLAYTIITEEDDILQNSSVSKLLITGDTSYTELNDSISSISLKEIWGSLIGTELNDIVYSVSAVVTNPIAVANIQELNDSISSTSNLLTHGSSENVEINDTANSTSTIVIKAISSNAEADDTISSTASIFINGNSTISEDHDTLSATTTNYISANLSINEQNDIIVSAGGTSKYSELSIDEQDDYTSSTSRLLIKSILTAVDDDDAIVSDSFVAIAGRFITIEANDTIEFNGLSTRNATVNVQENNDVTFGYSVIRVSATSSIIEQNDVLESIASPTFLLDANIIEGNDIVNSTSYIRYRVPSKQIITAEKTKTFLTLHLT